MNLDSRNNCFAFLRFFLASLVVFTHSFMLGGFKDPFAFSVFNFDSKENLGGIAVAGFFILSGFLITSSYLRLKSIPRFLLHRILRIYPAFLVCLMIPVFIIGPIIFLRNGGDLSGYFSSPTNNPLAYIINNSLLFIKQRPIINIFQSNPYPSSVNESLWTISYEFMAYLSVIVVGAIGLLRRFKIFTPIFFLLLWLLTNTILSLTNVLDSLYLSRIFTISKLFMFFYAGATFYLYKEKIKFNLSIFTVCALLLLLSMIYGFYLIVSPFVISYIIFYLAQKLPWNRFDKYGDFSYGLYIYAFPIQQFLVYLNINRLGALPLFLSSMILTTGIAFLSWRFIESPALMLKNRSLPLWQTFKIKARLAKHP